MSQIIRLNRAGREASFHTASASADAKAPVKIDGHVSDMSSGSGRSAKNPAFYQYRTADAGAEGQQDDIALSASRAP